MRRFLLLMLVAAAVAAVPVAQAGKPVIMPAPALNFTDDTTCGFDVVVHYVANAETMKIFDSGKILITGPLSATYSANGKTTAVLNISGPVEINGATALARGIGAGTIQMPDGTLMMVHAAGVVEFSSAGATLVHGHILLDICAALAP